MKTKSALTLVVFLSVLLFTASDGAYAQYWTSLAGGTAGWNYATCVYNGDLIIGGSFSAAGGVMANNIARWNGSSWAPLGSGVTGEVKALTVYNGELWVGGTFFEAGGLPVSYIAKWNGSTWSDPEGGMDSYVVALTSYNGLLIAGGYFTTANIPANHVAAWNGQSWSALGSGTGGTQGQVMALGVYNNELIAGGFFTTAGGINANHIAKWNGSSWSTLGSGISGIVYALTNYGGNLIAGGLFSAAGGAPAQDVAQWNGSSWAPLGGGVGGGLYGYCLGLAVNGNELCAGGMFTYAGSISANCIALWNGTSWFSNMDGGMFNSGATTAVNAVTAYQNGFAAGGIFTSAGSVSSANVAQWVESPPAQVHITLTPVNPPIVIPALGGSFNYNATVANQSGSSQSTQAWIMIQLPSLTWYGPVLGPISLTLPGGASLSRLRTQSIPASAPTGLYTYCGYLGTYPAIKTDSSSFTFTKSAVLDGSGGSGDLSASFSDWNNSGESFTSWSDQTPTQAPAQFQLDSYPNPFNPVTQIRYSLPQVGSVQLTVFDLQGKEVAVLVNGLQDAGQHSIPFDASRLASGIYLTRLQAEGMTTINRMALVK